MVRTASLWLLMGGMLAGCPDRDTGLPDTNRIDGGQDVPGADTPELDVPGLDVPGLDVPGLDAPGLDAPGMDVPGLDAPGLDVPGSDTPDAPLVSMPCMATGSCDPFDPMACPMGQTCRLGPMGAECLALHTTVARIGETCMFASSCEPGSGCYDFGGGSRCQRFCPEGSIGFCGPDQVCTGTIGDSCVQVCRPLAPRCDIYAQDCADTALSCTLVTNGETGERYTGCRPPGMVSVGMPCGGAAGTCVRGLVCVREMGVSTCHAVCNPEAGGPSCTMPETCSGTTTGWGVRYCRTPA